MSRIAKKPIDIPAGVEVELQNNNLTVKGSKGFLSLQVHSDVVVEQKNNQLFFSLVKDCSFKAIIGTMRTLVNNMVIGVNQGFERKLQLSGVGYRAQAKDNVLNLALGFSHPINYIMPTGVSVDTPSQTEIVIKGIDKQLVGQVAAEVRNFRRPEPYKGKGVCYVDEVVRRKESKKK